jgi:hypothetical protein
MDTSYDDIITDDPPRPDAQSGIVMSGSDLAKILGVGSSSLSQSARNGWQCRRYNVSEWAVWEDDRITSYDVPTEVVDQLTGPDAPDYPTPVSHSSPDAGRREPAPLQGPVAPAPESPRIQAPWMLPEGAYGTGFVPGMWPPMPVVAPPALPPLGTEQVTAELRRIIEDLHTQADRRTEEFERLRQALREDNDRLRDELRRIQDQHVKEIRDLERQLGKVREEASEKRFELRERLLDAQTDARLSEGGVEESWIERMMDRHGEDLASIVGGVAAAFANRIVRDPLLPALPVAETDDPFEADPPAPPDTAQEYSRSEMVERVVSLITTGTVADIETVVVALRSQMSGAEAAGLADAVVGELTGTEPAAAGARLRPVIEAQFPLALTVPPAMVVQMARGFGIAEGAAEADWLLGFVRAVQAPADTAPPRRNRARTGSKQETLTEPSNPS